MAEACPRPYTVLSCAVSLDGFLDDGTDERLILSNEADLDRVDDVRAWSDAILVGANTIRHDNPRLLVKCAERVRQRRAAGRPEQPIKVTLTNRAKLDADSQFFATGTALVYCARDTTDMATGQFGEVATVIDAGAPITLGWILDDLASRGVGRLLVEGGGEVHTQFLSQGLADELDLVIAPILIGEPSATRFVGPFTGRARLIETREIDEVVLLRYALSSRADDLNCG